jgi:hypothetical protein
MDDYDRVRWNLPMYETAAGGSGWRVAGETLSGLASCARWCNLPLDVVLRAASTNKLGQLIQKRGGTSSRRRLLRAHLARTDALLRRAELAAKLVPPWS